jgi:hypothetical protein
MAQNGKGTENRKATLTGPGHQRIALFRGTSMQQPFTHDLIPLLKQSLAQLGT